MGGSENPIRRDRRPLPLGTRFGCASCLALSQGLLNEDSPPGLPMTVVVVKLICLALVFAAAEGLRCHYVRLDGDGSA